jgi:hypothetical protein
VEVEAVVEAVAVVGEAAARAAVVQVAAPQQLLDDS